VTKPLTARSVAKIRAVAARDHLRIARDHLEAAQQDLCSLRGAAPLSWQLRDAGLLIKLTQHAIDCDAGDWIAEPAERLFELDHEPTAKDAEPHAGCGNRLLLAAKSEDL
jgi:hypothetical protein